MWALRKGPDDGPALYGVMRREEDVMSTYKVIEVIGTSATSWASPDMREWHVVPWRQHGEVPVGPARFQGGDEGPVLRGRRTLWRALALAGQ